MTNVLSQEWTEEIGRHRRVRGTDFSTNDLAQACLPLIRDLRRVVPGIYSVVLGTGDGLHVCSLGLQNGLDAARITALNASMFGIAGAHASVINPVLAKDHNTSLLINLPEENLMSLTKIEHAPVDHLVLAIYARGIPPGMLTHHAREISSSMSQWLAEN